jgi:hypothetical protein
MPWDFYDDYPPLKDTILEDMVLLDWFFGGERGRKPRTTKDRNPTFWEQTVPGYSDDDFMDDFRMSRNLFLWLCNSLRGKLRKDEQSKVSPSAALRLLLTTRS